MLRHTGQKRNYKHDLRLAVLLSLAAGFINAAGFFAFQVLTTNVTGHAALLAVNLASSQYAVARTAALWLLLFLLGAFCSSLIISRVGKHRPAAYTIPIVIVILIIATVAAFGNDYTYTTRQTAYFAGSLLFAMGMQNALVSMISGSVVRTTHLTGMFTDLGIDMASLVTGNKRNSVLRRRMLLRVIIIGSFLIGGLGGGEAFLNLAYAAFYIPAAILLVALFYDYFRLKVIRAVRK